MKEFKEPNRQNGAKAKRKLHFETLYKSNVNFLWHEAYRILQDRQAADDAVQELFIEFWEKKIFDNIKSNIKSYLFISIRRKCYKLQNQRKIFSEIDHSIEKNILYREDHSDSREINAEIKAAMAEMSPQTSRAFELYVLEDKKRKEVAVELGISDNTVKSYLATAMKIARRKLLTFRNNSFF